MKRKCITAAVAATVIVLCCLFVRPDYFPALDTYGLSVGGNTAYCSIELANGSLQAACQSGH